MYGWKKKCNKANLAALLKLCGLSLLTGMFGGVVGGAFAHALHWAADAREHCPWLLLLLPVGGVLTVLLLRLFKLSDHGGVGELVKNMEQNTPVRVLIAPAIFLCTVITHLFGGSSGKEGAALQIGGGGAAAIAKVFRLNDRDRNILVMSGMSAMFAGVFGTPLTAAFFVLEFKAAFKKLPLAGLPCLIAAFSARYIAALLGVHKEAMSLAQPLSFEVVTLGKLLVLTLLVGALGAVMCFAFRKSKELPRKLIKKPVVRILLGSCLILGLTIAVGDMRYNGSGMEMAVKAIGGTADPFDFAMKLLFTAITLAAGFKGGEIVPTFCIGATFGCVMGGVLGISPSLGAAMGLVVLFACATNSLAGAFFLGLELFGLPVLPYLALLCPLATLLSGPQGLFYGRVPKSPLCYLVSPQG